MVSLIYKFWELEYKAPSAFTNKLLSEEPTFTAFKVILPVAKTDGSVVETCKILPLPFNTTLPVVDLTTEFKTMSLLALFKTVKSP